MISVVIGTNTASSLLADAGWKLSSKQNFHQMQHYCVSVTINQSQRLTLKNETIKMTIKQKGIYYGVCNSGLIQPVFTPGIQMSLHMRPQSTLQRQSPFCAIKYLQMTVFNGSLLIFHNHDVPKCIIIWGHDTKLLFHRSAVLSRSRSLMWLIAYTH